MICDEVVVVLVWVVVLLMVKVFFLVRFLVLRVVVCLLVWMMYCSGVICSWWLRVLVYFVISLVELNLIWYMVLWLI